ncbi:MAG: hypothetical protein CMB52_04625 [Euryarchaeota archaeon]|nr:hypothetical protein [Euryarchaeota archaeon]
MTIGHGRSVLMVLAILTVSFSPLASASGSGLLLDANSLTIAGDQEVGVGAVNISIDVHAHDSNSAGFLEMTFTSQENTPIASENRSINLNVGETELQQFNISSVPIGTHTLSLQLWGDVGVDLDNNVSQIVVFVQKYSPAEISIEEPSSWDIIPVNSSVNDASGNSTMRDGDHAWIHAEVQNSGDLDWSGNATLNVNGTSFSVLPTIVAGQTTTVVNFSVGPLGEGSVVFSIEMDNGSNLIDSGSISVDIGPPPLPRPTMHLEEIGSNSELGDSANWTVGIENTGESVFHGVLHCDFPLDVEFINQSITLQPAENFSTNFTLLVRPGTLTCHCDSTERLHDDSVIVQTHAYDMAAGHIMRAGSDGLTITGGPFHVGDSIPLAILVHNGGDFSGEASLEIRESPLGSSSQNGSWVALDSRNLEVGSSLELSAQYPSTIAGERMIEWRIVSSNSLVSEDCFGQISLNVQPSQSLEVVMDSYTWTLSEGLDVEFTTSLSSGESREVLLEIGSSGASGEVPQISAQIHLSPGQRTLSYDLGHPTASSFAWVRLTPISWSSLTIAEDQLELIRPNPQLSISLDSTNPDAPKPGMAATVSYTLNNSGASSTLPGELILVDTKHDGEVLWVGSAPVVASESTYSDTISLESWPDDSAVDLSLIWYTSGVGISETGSFLSQSQENSDSGYTIDWVAIVYGSLAGLLIGLVTRTVMRARAGVPLMSRRERGERTAKPKKKATKKVEDKVEVACPACDQRLRVPSTYSGTARCPACAQTFPVEATVEPEEEDEEEYEEDVSEEIEEEILPQIEVEPIEEPEEKSSSSSSDIIKCPDCEQKLKVPFDRRPVRARCPACKCEFKALQE